MELTRVGRSACSTGRYALSNNPNIPPGNELSDDDAFVRALCLSGRFCALRGREDEDKEHAFAAAPIFSATFGETVVSK